ncbi:MAG: protease modulator HflC [Candidatus Methylumidiphilus sp.]
MNRNTLILGTSALGLVLAAMSMFTVGESQKAIKFRLGKIVETSFDPGLHFQIPIINNVKKFDARLLTLDSTPALFMTSEKKNVSVDYFVKWKIKDVAKFYTSVSGDVTQANIRLDQIVQPALRIEFSNRTIKDVVSTDRAEIRQSVIDAANRQVNENTDKEGRKGLGIEIVDIRIIRIDLPKEVSASVYRRMESERTGVAWSFRARGAEMAERKRADADREREVILGNAYRDAEIKRGEGDATSAEIYAKAYGQDKDFFAFYRSLSAYRQAFKNEGDAIVLEPNSEFFQYFKKSTK